MTGEADNLPTGGTDNAQPSTSLDDPRNLDFHDPSEDTVEPEPTEESTDETVETDDETDGQETEETPVEDDDAEDDGQADEESEPDTEGEDDDEAAPLAAEVSDDAVITLPNGESVTFGEAKAGYLRQSDYSRKTQELGNKRRELEALATNVNASVDALAGLLEKTLPPMPDQALAFKNPQQHYAMKTAREQAEQRLAEVLQAAHAPKEAANNLTQQQQDDLKREELTRLAEDFPQIKTQDGFKQFFDSTSEVARQLGYSDDEIGNATDHRLFKLAHYARLGMQAEAAKVKAKDKVRNAPPVAPAKRQKGPGANKARKNQEAVRRLQKTGSIHDAMAIDFD